MAQQGYFEQTYQGPWKGIDVSMPPNKIGEQNTPNASNWIPRAGELRSRPRYGVLIDGPPDGSFINGHTAFIDSNNVAHTCAITNTGLWQLNAKWRKNPANSWNLIQRFPGNNFPAPNNPASSQIFIDKLFFTLGDVNLWQWDGITPSGKNPKPALQSIAVYDVTNNLTAGGLFLGELDSHLLLLNTTEQVQAAPGQPKLPTNFQQRIRWCVSGEPVFNVVTGTGGWDPTRDIGAGFDDLFDTPDAITGFITIGRTGFIFRVNGITELIPISQGLLPFDFDHLWASDRGIGSVFPFSIVNYGPIGMFISNDDIYQISISGFQKVGGKARNAIFEDLDQAVFAPIASMFPTFRFKYPYLTYLLAIPFANNKTKLWCYFVEDECWFPWGTINGYITGKIRVVPTI